MEPTTICNCPRRGQYRPFSCRVGSVRYQKPPPIQQQKQACLLSRCLPVSWARYRADVRSVCSVGWVQSCIECADFLKHDTSVDGKKKAKRLKQTSVSQYPCGQVLIEKCPSPCPHSTSVSGLGFRILISARLPRSAWKNDAINKWRNGEGARRRRRI